MKATLEFNLPEDALEFETASNAGKWKSLVWDIDQYLRNEIKYRDEFVANELETLEKIRDKVYLSLEEYGLTLD